MDRSGIDLRIERGLNETIPLFEDVVDGHIHMVD